MQTVGEGAQGACKRLTWFTLPYAPPQLPPYVGF